MRHHDQQEHQEQHDQQEHQEQHGQQGEQQERLPFALLVGADGRQSTVRQQIPSAYLPQETFDLAPFVPAGSAAARRVRVPGLSQTTVRIGHDSGTAHTSYIPALCSSVIVPLRCALPAAPQHPQATFSIMKFEQQHNTVFVDR